MTTYRLAVAGRLPESAGAWLADLGATPVEASSTVSTIEVDDQSALVGLVNRLHGLGVVIEEVVRMP